jgi:ketosteroid isomerase-like protein
MDTFHSLKQRSDPCYHPRVRKVRRPLLVAASLLILGGCGGPRQPSGPDSALADTLKGLIGNAYDFTRPGIVERMNALYPDTGRVISASGGQIISSPDSVRKGIATFWTDVGQNMQNPRWQWDSVYVDRLGPDAAVMTARWSIPHVAPNNQPHVITGTWTAVFRRISGQWKIVQEHLSS